MTTLLLGLDVGGSSIKGALVDVDSGRLATELRSVQTPQPATPDRVAAACAALDRELGGRGPVGFAFPSVVRRNVARTAANVDPSWIGVNGVELLGSLLRRPVLFINDADAAGLAEMRWGAGRGTTGTVIMLTFGTGIGSAIFVDGRLLPNTEFGHLELRGRDAELWASARVRTEERLDWVEWAERVNEYLARMHALLWPDVFIIGGAVTENFHQFGAHLRSEAQIRVAQFTGQAGAVGAALAASALA
ncbi:MAG: ROK family protein [Steroidobacteraceae bacterium]